MSDPTKTLLQQHPSIFHGKWPGTENGLPSGWIRTVSTFFTFLESNCTQEQLASLVLEDISEQDGYLALIYHFGAPLREDQIDIVGARAFFTRNRCAVSCLDCGKIVETLSESGTGVHCHACTVAALDG
jgi:ribosomal protein S27E